MDEVYCPTAARNEVLILLSWLTVVLVLFSRKRLAQPPAEPAENPKSTPEPTPEPTAEPESTPTGPAGANLSPGASQVRSRAGETTVKSAGWI